MKIKLPILLFFISTVCFSQNYALDNSFGNNGMVTNLGMLNRGVLQNNHYYFFGPQIVVKMNYDGSLVTDFGTNGTKFIYMPDKSLDIKDVKFHDGYFYIYGRVFLTGLSDFNMFIMKIDESGNFDANFGSNGYAEFNTSTSENIKNFIVEPNGQLFCIGSSNGKMIYFKVNPNGTLDFTYDANGYKSFTIGNLAEETTYGAIIIPDGNKYILGGNCRYSEPGVGMRGNLMLIRINQDGSLDNTYGTNGHKLTYLELGAIEMVDMHIVGNSLFSTYYYGYSFLDQGNKIVKYNLSNDQIAFTMGGYRESYINPENENAPFYKTGYQPCYSGPCSRNMFMSRYLPNGTPDNTLTFYGNPQLEYSSNDTTFSDDISAFYIVGPDNRIVIGGSRIIRIAQSQLSVDTQQSATAAIYPVPFKDKIYIDASLPIQNIEITDQIGRKIMDVSVNPNDLNSGIDVSSITQSGTYYLRMRTSENTLITKKIIRE